MQTNRKREGSGGCGWVSYNLKTTYHCNNYWLHLHSSKRCYGRTLIKVNKKRRKIKKEAPCLPGIVCKNPLPRCLNQSESLAKSGFEYNTKCLKILNEMLGNYHARSRWAKSHTKLLLAVLPTHSNKPLHFLSVDKNVIRNKARCPPPFTSLLQ